MCVSHTRSQYSLVPNRRAFGIKAPVAVLEKSSFFHNCRHAKRNIWLYLVLDSPFTVVDAFSLSYRYLPFLVDFFYIFTYFVWWGDLIFRRLLKWVRLLAVKWENKKTSPQNSANHVCWSFLLSTLSVIIVWYFGSAHSLEKVMGVFSRLGGAGVDILNSYTIGLLTNGPCSCYASS